MVMGERDEERWRGWDFNRGMGRYLTVVIGMHIDSTWVISSLDKRVPTRYNGSMEITPRQKEILSQIIEEYAETASPVGSVTMAKLFNVSPATIRAEMARLEVLGLIAQPHTSAGRVPTDAGYRFYVNELSKATEGAEEDFGGAEMPKFEMRFEVPGVKLLEDGGLTRGKHVLEVRVGSQIGRAHV